MAYGTAVLAVIADTGDSFVAETQYATVSGFDVTDTSPAQYSLGFNDDGGIYGTQLDLVSDSRLSADFAPGLRLATEEGEHWLAYPDGHVGADGDYTFRADTVGPVLTDSSDGHTYRIVSTAGVLSTVQVS